MPIDACHSLTDFFRGFDEDEVLRSEMVWHLFVAERGGNDPSGVSSRIPKVLVRFWDTADALPPDAVSTCLNVARDAKPAAS